MSHSNPLRYGQLDSTLCKYWFINWKTNLNLVYNEGITWFLLFICSLFGWERTVADGGCDFIWRNQEVFAGNRNKMTCKFVQILGHHTKPDLHPVFPCEMEKNQTNTLSVICYQLLSTILKRSRHLPLWWIWHVNAMEKVTDHWENQQTFPKPALRFHYHAFPTSVYPPDPGFWSKIMTTHCSQEQRREGVNHGAHMTAVKGEWRQSFLCHFPSHDNFLPAKREYKGLWYSQKASKQYGRK